MGADLGGVKPGDVVAVWGAGAVGQMAARASMLLGAERVIVIDRFDYRLAMTKRHIGAETINYTRTAWKASFANVPAGEGRMCASKRSHGSAQHRPPVPVRPGQVAAAAAAGPARSVFTP